MTEAIRILELRSVWGTGGGPEKTILLGAEQSDANRFAVTVCYMRDERDTVFGIDRRAGALPIDYVEVREKHSFDPGVWGQLRRIIRTRRIDIVHSHDYKTNLLAWLLSKVEPITPLSTVHGWTGHSRREAWLYYPADKRVLARFPRLVAVSGDIRRELIRHGAKPDRVTTILNGIDHRRFRRDPARTPEIRRVLGYGPEHLVVGAVGRAEPQKRFDLLVEAVASLVGTWPQLRLLIVGDGSQRETLQAQVARLGLAGHVSLAGHRNDIPDLHHAMDLFVQSSDYEGTPNAVLEAMALGTPVVATDVGGTAELIRDGVDGRIISPGSAQGLAAAIGAALANPDERRAHATHARHRVETVLSFEARMDALEAIYTELHERGHSGPVMSALAS